MFARKILAAGVLGACALVTLTGPARANMMGPTCQLVSSGGETGCPATAPGFMVPGQYNYGDSFAPGAASGKLAGADINGGSPGFIDDYLFQISPASADAVSATINDKTHAVSNLFARLYSLSTNAGGLVLTEPSGTTYNGIVTDLGQVTVVTINPVTLAAGSYVLEISGTASGSSGGSYTGTLNLSPVPLPPSFALLLTGLLGLAGLALPRSRHVSEGIPCLRSA